MNGSPKTRIATISELAVTCPGYSPRPEERKKHGKYLLIGGRNINDGRLVRNPFYLDSESGFNWTANPELTGHLIRF